MSSKKKYITSKTKRLKISKLMRSQKSKSFTNHHDMFFKSFYSNPDFAFELFTLIFHEDELKAYDWKHLKIEKDTLKEKRADLIFSVPLKATKNRVKIFILLEHKSHYDSDLFSQLLYYQTLIHEESLKAGLASLAIPVVVYHGRIPWRWHKSLQESIYKEHWEKIPVRSRKNMINYEIKLLDAHDPKLRGVFKNKSFKSRGALYLLKEIWGLRLSQTELKEVLVLFGDLSDSRQNKLIASVSDYLKSVLKAGKEFKKIWETVEKELVREGVFKRGGYMDTLQHVEERGRIKGRKEGRQEGQKELILNMLKEKMDIKTVSKVTGLSEAEIKKLKSGC